MASPFSLFIPTVDLRAAVKVNQPAIRFSIYRPLGGAETLRQSWNIRLSPLDQQRFLLQPRIVTVHQCDDGSQSGQGRLP